MSLRSDILCYLATDPYLQHYHFQFVLSGTAIQHTLCFKIQL